MYHKIQICIIEQFRYRQLICLSNTTINNLNLIIAKLPPKSEMFTHLEILKTKYNRGKSREKTSTLEIFFKH